MSSWREAAACLGMDTDIFFPLEVLGGPKRGKGTPGEKARAEAAKEICARCGVIDSCLDYAIGNGDEFGIWGGTTPGERRNLGRKCA